MLTDLVTTGDAQIDTAFADEGGDIGGGEEYQCDVVILDESDVETGVAVELDV